MVIERVKPPTVVGGFGWCGYVALCGLAKPSYRIGDRMIDPSRAIIQVEREAPLKSEVAQCARFDCG